MQLTGNSTCGNSYHGNQNSSQVSYRYFVRDTNTQTWLLKDYLLGRKVDERVDEKVDERVHERVDGKDRK